jgi:hypothetical protein
MLPTAYLPALRQQLSRSGFNCYLWPASFMRYSGSIATHPPILPMLVCSIWQIELNTDEILVLDDEYKCYRRRGTRHLHMLIPTD